MSTYPAFMHTLGAGGLFLGIPVSFAVAVCVGLWHQFVSVPRGNTSAREAQGAALLCVVIVFGGSVLGFLGWGVADMIVGPDPAVVAQQKLDEEHEAIANAVTPTELAKATPCVREELAHRKAGAGLISPREFFDARIACANKVQLTAQEQTYQAAQTAALAGSVASQPALSASAP